MTNLSDQQLAGIEKIKNWYDNLDAGGVFRLFGPAGTGKTTLAKEIPAALGLDRVVYGTYTGKAAHVLRSKGAGPVSTIHSAIYFPATSAEAKRRLADAREDYRALSAIKADGTQPLTEDEERALADLQVQIPIMEAEAKRLSFEWNPDSEWSRADLIVLDEVSMVNAKVAADVEAYGVPILVLGDPAQLPPVEGGGYYTDGVPDVLLTEVHRQALENPITALATRIRESQGARLGLESGDLEPASIGRAMGHDQVLVWSNKRRWAMIKAIRDRLGRPEGEVVAGDRIMCLTNNKDLAVFNGAQFTVLDSRPGVLGPTLTLEDDEGRTRDIPVFADGFLGQELQAQAKDSGAGLRGGRMLATFAQAITVHKAQGSEWDSVYVVNETDAMVSMVARRQGAVAAATQGRQWLYTAVTRAKETVTITAPRGAR